MPTACAGPSLAGREQDAATIAATWMQTLGYDHVETDTYGSVIGRIQGDTGAGPTLHFDGHLDTVPATALDQWTHAPYGADIDAEHIWGRGSTDMKGPVAAMLCAARLYPANGCAAQSPSRPVLPKKNWKAQPCKLSSRATPPIWL
ncbi:MAG: M20/M25/M40 family metallo-hydrolase [Chloroflexaceae bacterium]|nr:M20/M25/M40 family metallo-hydrolase [Chloroflexaceae bacterium]